MNGTLLWIFLGNITLNGSNPDVSNTGDQVLMRATIQGSQSTFQLLYGRELDGEDDGARPASLRDR